MVQSIDTKPQCSCLNCNNKVCKVVTWMCSKLGFSMTVRKALQTRLHVHKDVKGNLRNISDCSSRGRLMKDGVFLLVLLYPIVIGLIAGAELGFEKSISI